ncbi:signal recognition particle protein, partial [Acinetobacter baumannii]
NKMMKQMGLNPNNLPKNMLGGTPDMSALEGMMGQGGMPDLSALGGAGMPDMSQLFGGGLKGKAGEFLMRRSMNKMAKQ